MKTLAMFLCSPAVGVVPIIFYLLLSGIALAHCDTTGGPIIPEVKAALGKGDVSPILKWVKKEYEPGIKAAFARALVVRSKGQEAKELADQYFIETLIRLHRTGEGAPYTGIKDEPVEPIVALADRAVADGSVDDLINEIGMHMREAIKEKFNKAVEARKNKDKSVEAGRKYVDAYVTYVHYVEGVYTIIISPVGHHHAGGSESSYHDTEEPKEHKK